jgi:hypothetical protein
MGKWENRQIGKWADVQMGRYRYGGTSCANGMIHAVGGTGCDDTAKAAQVMLIFLVRNCLR